MSMSRNTIQMMIYKIITLLIVLSASATAATYNGKSVDGVSFGCSLKLGREIQPCSVIFDGKSASVKLSKKTIYVRLASEVIDDPKDIEGYFGEEAVLLDVNLTL